MVCFWMNRMKCYEYCILFCSQIRMFSFWIDTSHTTFNQILAHLWNYWNYLWVYCQCCRVNWCECLNSEGCQSLNWIFPQMWITIYIYILPIPLPSLSTTAISTHQFCSAVCPLAHSRRRVPMSCCPGCTGRQQRSHVWECRWVLF